MAVSTPSHARTPRRKPEKKSRKMKPADPGRSAPAVAVVDDDRFVCDAIAETLRSVGCEPTCVTDPTRFLAGERLDRFDCLILDVRMPGMSGLEVQQELNRRAIDVPIVFVSGHGDIPMAMSAARAGALHFLEKPFREQVLLDAVHEAIAEAARRRAERVKRDQLRAQVLALSPREREVAQAVASGQSAGEIARRLDLSSRTVEMHKLRAMRRLGVSSSTELTRLIVEAQAAGVAMASARSR